MIKNYTEVPTSFSPFSPCKKWPTLFVLLFISLAKLTANEETITIYGDYTSTQNISSGAITTISQRDIENSGAATAADVIKRYAPILINTNGTRDSINSTSIRGSRSTQVAILIDGVKVNSPTGAGGNDLSKMPASLIEKIEIIASPSSSFSGDQIGGGTILITTKSSHKASYEASYLYNHNNGHEIKFFTTQPVPNKDSTFFTGASFLYNPKEKPIVGGDTIIQTIIANGVFNFKKESPLYSISLTNYLEENFNKENTKTTTQLFNSLHGLSFQLKNPLAKFLKSSYNLTFAFRPIDSRYTPYNYQLVKNLTLDFTLKNNLNFVHLWDNNSLTFGISLNYNPQFLLSSTIGNLHRHNLNLSSGIEIDFSHEEREVGLFQFSTSLDGILGDKNLIFASAFAFSPGSATAPPLTYSGQNRGSVQLFFSPRLPGHRFCLVFTGLQEIFNFFLRVEKRPSRNAGHAPRTMHEDRICHLCVLVSLFPEFSPHALNHGLDHLLFAHMSRLAGGFRLAVQS